MISRREFVQIGAAVGAGMLLPAGVEAAFAFSPAFQPAPANPLRLTKYVDNLPLLGIMPTAAPNFYRVGAYQFKSKAHSQMQPTTVWGYRPLGFVPSLTKPEATWLGPSFAIARGTRTKVEWQNKLNGIPHPLPVDPSIDWANPLNQVFPTSYPVDNAGNSTFNYTLNTVPMVPHVHGGEQPPGSDGGPLGWFTPGSAITGPTYDQTGDIQADFSPSGKHNVYPYYNTQLPATIWYHDHCMGLTRLNVYMGMAGAYVIYDTTLEPGLNVVTPGVGLPTLLDTVLHPTFHDKFGQPYDIPIVIQDRIFDVHDQLWYPGLSATNPTVHPLWTPEFFGDTICVNGKAWPKLRVEPRKYRFRLLDGSNARFYNLTLFDQTAAAAGPGMTVVASDAGYLANPAPLAPGVGLTFAPGERYEVIVDFAAFAGHKIIMMNDAAAPFPGGDPGNFNVNTVGQIMMFDVDATPVVDSSVIPAVLNPVLGTTFPSINVNTTAPTVVRQLTLNEKQGPGGPLLVVENNSFFPMTVGGMVVHPNTETPKVGTTEVWRIVNMTADTHPIHTHLASFQLLQRQDFDTVGYSTAYQAAFTGAPAYDPQVPTGPPLAYTDPAQGTLYGAPIVGGNPNVTPFLTAGTATGPQQREQGWKDTVLMHTGQVTDIVIRFTPNDNTTTAGTVYPFVATGAPGYVWHCHIIDHEDNDMMRTFEVTP